MTGAGGTRRMPLAALRDHLDALSGDALERALRSVETDPRAGARALAGRYRRRAAAGIAEDMRLAELFRYELTLRDQGYAIIAGADEVGRGALAGPIVAAAAVLAPERPIPGLKDSKLLDSAHREALFQVITDQAVSFAVVELTAAQIDEHGIQLANMMVLRKAVEALDVACEYVLADGFTLAGMDIPSLGLVRGDRLSASVAAASIVAKVTRDRFMRQAADRYPGYGFDEHVGYSTAGHMEALRRLGPCPLHRRSFAPVGAAAQEGLGLL